LPCSGEILLLSGLPTHCYSIHSKAQGKGDKDSRKFPLRYFNILHDKAAEKLVQELKSNMRTDLLNSGFPNFSLKLVDSFVGSKHHHATTLHLLQRKMTIPF